MKTSSELAEKIKSYAKTKNIPIGKLLSECGLSVNALSSMKSGGYFPRLEAITRIADCLGCSIDYLLGRSDNPESHISSAEIEDEALGALLLNIFKGLSDGDKYYLLGIALNLDEIKKAALKEYYKT